MKKFVADANILFSLGKESSKTNQIVNKYNLELYSPSYALDELKKHSKEIEEKTKESFDNFSKNIKNKVNFIKTEEILKEIESCAKLISDSEDIIYLALAKKLNLPIWSNDKDFKEQYERLAITTEEMIELLQY